MAVDLTKNQRWVKRMDQYFDSVDLNKNGYLTIDEFMQWAENMRVLCKATDSEMTKLKEQLRIFWGTVGLKPGIEMPKDEFIQGMNRLARDELDRQQRGVKTLHEQLNNAFFDVMDVNNDGIVTLDELKTMMKACKMDPEGAESWLSAADYNKNGKVERQELNKFEFDFWFHPEKEETSNMFGGAYSGN